MTSPRPKAGPPLRGQAGKIQVRCSGSALVDPELLIPFQGAFKGMTQDEKQRFRTQLGEMGIRAAATVWKRESTAGAELILLDGHQRREVLLDLRKEGWKVPAVPVNYVTCKDDSDARRTILGLASTYGRVNRKELQVISDMAGFKLEDLDTRFSFPDLDLSAFNDLKNGQPQTVSFEVKPKKHVECPACSHHFTPSKLPPA